MASGNGGGGGGEVEYYKILVSGVPICPNPEELLRTRFQDKLGHVIHVRSHPPTCAIVTLRCLPGQSYAMPRQLNYSELGGSILTLYNLGTEKTTLTMGNLLPQAIQKLAELAPAYRVTCVQTGASSVHLSGLMDNVYNLRSEVDAFLVRLVQDNTSTSPQPSKSASQHASLPSMSSHHTHPISGRSSHTHPLPGSSSHTPPSGHAASQSSIPLHLQQAPFSASNSSAPLQPTAPHANTTPSPVTSGSSVFNPNSPLRPPTFNPSGPTPQSIPALPPVTQPTSTPPASSHQYQPTTTSVPNSGEPHSNTGHETFTTPPSSPTAVSQPGGLVPGTTATLTHDPSSPPPEGPGSPSPPQGPGDEERNNVFTNLNCDALALLERLPEGDIPGVRYNAKAGSVQIEPQEKSDVDDTILKFQDAYKKVAVSRDRRLRVEYVDVPLTTTKEEVVSQITKFEQQYRFCAFVYEEEKQKVKVISQSRQFEQAKQFFRDALQEPQATDSSAAEMVITLSSRRKLTLKKANIAEEEVDIIVNAANGSLLHGGGVAGALNTASQGQLQKYCTRFMERIRKGDEIPVGEVAVTHAGGALRCKYVIHAVGPDNTRNSPSESERLIQLAIINTLKAAEKYNIISIAIPALSCGIFGVSKKIVARSITDTILGFQFTKSPPTLSDIRIVIIDESTHTCFAHYFAQIPQRAVKGTAALSGHSSGAKGATGATGHGKKGEPTGQDMPLSMKDLTWLMMQLKSIAPKWKEVVIELSPSNDQLLSMMGSSSDPVVQLNKGLARWLIQTTPTPTLGALARALSSKAVGEREKATEIVKAGDHIMKLRAEEPSSGFPEVKYPTLPTEDSMNEASGVSHPNGAGHQGNTALKSSLAHATEDECPICLDTFKAPMETKCGHKFCTSCIEKALQYDPYCPSCKKPLRPITGKQPPGGTMSHMVFPYSVPGYEGYRTIQITYNIPNGVQGPEHPNPGQPYYGTTRVAYLPDSVEGREVFQLLQKAFQARLIFTVGTSVTTGAQNVVVWNDIHHKTTVSGGQQGYGYPDPTYLQRVKEDLAAKGIVPHSSVV